MNYTNVFLIISTNNTCNDDNDGRGSPNGQTVAVPATTLGDWQCHGGWFMSWGLPHQFLNRGNRMGLIDVISALL